MSVEDVVIVGSGPAGYTAAIYAARAGYKPVVFAGALAPGGALMTTTEVENFPGWPEGILGPDLMDKFQEQAEKFGADIRFEDIETMDLTGEIKTLTNDMGDSIQAKAVILSLGSAHRELGVPGEKEFGGKGVSYCATCDGFFFRDQEIAIVGGGDSAITEALFLTRFAKKVYVVHRRDALRASQVLADRAAAEPKIEFVWNSTVAQVNGDQKVTSLTLDSTVGEPQRELPVTGLFVSIGHDPRTQAVKGQVDLDEQGYISVKHPSQHTNLPGVFAAGDVVDHFYRQAITASGAGCRAALDAQHYLENQG